MRIVVAPDSFKGTASARVVAAAIAAGWREARPGDDLRTVPMADGGEGTLDAFEAAVAGAERAPVIVLGPDGHEVAASWLRLPDGTGVVELAATSGLTLLRSLAALDAHAFGFGQAIAAALDAGVDRLLLAIGGSASTDGGAPMLMALGAHILDAGGESVGFGGGRLESIASVDLGAIRALPPGGVVVLSDVTNPLLGPAGASAVFGEQKGADAAQREALERGLAHWASFVPVDPAAAGAGAAGGVGFAAMAWGARVESGARAVAEAVGLPAAIRAADLVITGEGRFDGQTGGGKAPWVVAELAREAGVPVALVAGSIEARPAGFAAALSLIDLAGGLDAALADPGEWLRRAGASLAQSSL